MELTGQLCVMLSLNMYHVCYAHCMDSTNQNLQQNIQQNYVIRTWPITSQQNVLPSRKMA